MTNDVRAKVEEFFSHYRLREYSKGQVLIFDGEGTNYVYYLVKGKVKEYDVTYKGEEMIIAVFKPPAFFPMSLAINNKISPYVYETESFVEMRKAPAEDVLAFIRSNPDTLYDLISRAYRGVDGLIMRMTLAMSGTAMERILYELIIEARRFGTKQGNGSYLLSINEKELGSRAALSRETVSREVVKLKSEDLINVHSRKIIINDMSALEKKLGKAI
jgi:CRP-like cAMP-binding protein